VEHVPQTLNAILDIATLTAVQMFVPVEVLAAPVIQTPSVHLIFAIAMFVRALSVLGVAQEVSVIQAFVVPIIVVLAKAEPWQPIVILGFKQIVTTLVEFIAEMTISVEVQMLVV